MEFRILGPLVVVFEGRELPLGPLKDRTVLGVLLLHANEVVPRQRLIDELWGEAPPPTAIKAVNGSISQLRKALGGNGGGPIATRPPGYLIEAAGDELDALRFVELTIKARAQANAAAFEAASTTYTEALSLWRGRTLSGIDLESVDRHEVERLDEARVVALMDRIDCDLALGRQDDLVGELEVLVAQHPLRERLHAQLILTLYRSGRQAEALRAYQQARTVLVEELGLEPSPALQRLERGILNHDAALQVPQGTAHRNGLRTRAGPPSDREPTTPQRPRRRLLLVGAGLVLLGGIAAVVAVTRDGSAAEPIAVRSPVALLVEPKSARVDASLPLPGRPIGLAADGEKLWLATTGELVRLSRRGTPGIETLDAGGTFGGVAVGDGSVWVTDEDSGTVLRIDAATGTVVDRTRSGNDATAALFAAGSLWVANEADGTVSRIDPARDKLTATIPVGGDPHALAFGAGSLWVSDGQLGTITRVDVDTNLPLNSISIGTAPTTLAFGEEALWVGNAQGGGVSRIDPHTGRVLSTTALGRTADAIAIVAHRVWAASTAAHRLEEIDPGDGRVLRTVELGGSPIGLDRLGSLLAVTALPASTTHRGGTLIATGPGSDATLDPATWFFADGWTLLGATNDGLLTVGRDAGSAGSVVVPDLARSLPVVRDGGTTYTFELRSGLHYSTGRSVQAGDVRASIERLWRITPRFLAYESDLRLGLRGEARCAARPSRCDLRQAIVSNDREGTVTFHLARPNPSFLRLLTLPFYALLPAGTPARDHRVLPATGPYEISAYRPHRRLILVRNHWFQPRAERPDGYPDRIVWRLDSPSVERATQDVLDGRADYLVSWTMPADLVARLALRHASQLHTASTQWLTYLFLNTRIPPFNRLAARRALSEAIDRRRVIKATGGPLAVRATCQIVPPGNAGYRPYCPYSLDANPAGSWIAPDLAAARTLVRRSHTVGMKVTIWAADVPRSSDPSFIPLAHYVATVLRSLGYRASVASVKGKTSGPYYARIAAPQARAQIGVANWIPDFADNTAIFPVVLGCGVSRQFNVAGFCDPRTDQLIRQAGELESTDQAAASRLWSTIDRRVTNRAPWIPLVYWQSNTVVSRRLGNYIYKPQPGFVIDQAWVR